MYVLNETSNFDNVAGLELNLTKTDGLWLGKGFTNNCAGIKWPVHPIRCLGVCFGRNEKKLRELNWDCKTY